MDQQDDRARATGSEQLQPQQQQQQRGQQTHEQDAGPASYGNSGDPAGLEQGQSSAGASGAEQDETRLQADRAAQSSTVAQRSGGQTDGGKGMGNESFEGSSLGGQSVVSHSARAMFNDEQIGDGQRDSAKPSALDGE